MNKILIMYIYTLVNVHVIHLVVWWLGYMDSGSRKRKAKMVGSNNIIYSIYVIKVFKATNPLTKSNQLLPKNVVKRLENVQGH